MRPHLDRLPGPLGQQPAGHQAAHRFLQAVVVALLPGPGVLGSHRRRQRLQHRGDHGGALGRQVAGDDARTLEGGLDTELAVLEVRLRVVLRVGEGAGVDLRGQGGQVLPPGARLGRGDQDLIGGAGTPRGTLLVQPQIVRAIDSVSTVPSASAAATCGCAMTRRAQPRWPRAAPLVTLVRWISHAVGL